MEENDDDFGETSTEEDFTEEKLRFTLEIIQNNSLQTKEIYKALISIRTKVLNQSNGIELIQKVNGVQCLLKMLSHTNEDILNIVISILGNLCNHLISNTEFREEIVKNKIAGRIVAILRIVSKPSIQKRVCRFIGNIAQTHVISKELHQAGVSHAIIHVLTEAQDVELQQLAIRALRWLWNVGRHYVDMLRAGVVKAVAHSLTSTDPRVEMAAVRALVKFTSLTSSITRSVEQISCFQEIVDRISQPAYPVLISNLSYDPAARRELCKAGIVPAIIDRLQEGKINSYLISGLCRMCRESMVRASLRHYPSGFSTLLSLLAQEKMKHFHPELLEAIEQFKYDQSSLMMLVRCGLIGTLIEKLSDYTTGHCTGHSEPVGSSDWLGGSPVTSPASSWAASPSPPPTSPTSALLHQAPSTSSGCYSPRCDVSSSDSESEPLSTPAQTTDRAAGPEVGLDGCVIEILMRLAYLGSPMRALAAKSSITTLLNYLSRVSYPRYQGNFNKAYRALVTILLHKHYWNILLDEESVLDIHAKLCRPVHQECSECTRLCETGRNILRELGLTAQCGLGEGEMIYRLNGVNPQPRVTTALSIPHVIRQPNLLEGLLYSHGGLAVLLDTLSSRTEEAVCSLHSLFSTLDVKNPQSKAQICPGCEIGEVRKESTVLLRTEEGEEVPANREALAHSCPVFEAMFRGGFKESSQSSVLISSISASCLSHLTRILPEYCSCALPKDLAVLLEMISATDRFLLPELSALVVSVVRDSVLGPSTAHQIYSWALRSGQSYPLTAGLPAEVVSYLFSSEHILPAQRVRAVASILASDDRDFLLADISAIVRQALSAYTKTHRRYQKLSELSYVSYDS